jgi:hypothetical protein
MKSIPLTQGKVAIVDDDRYDELSKTKWNYLSVGYARSGNGKILMHRLIVGASRGELVDHIDGNKLNNQKENLRICTKSQNAMNSEKKSNNRSGYKGVAWSKQMQKWDVRIKANGRRVFIGLFDDVHDAAIAYNDSARFFFGEFAKLNI